MNTHANTSHTLKGTGDEHRNMCHYRMVLQRHSSQRFLVVYYLVRSYLKGCDLLFTTPA